MPVGGRQVEGLAYTKALLIPGWKGMLGLRLEEVIGVLQSSWLASFRASEHGR